MWMWSIDKKKYVKYYNTKTQNKSKLNRNRNTANIGYN